MIQAITPTKKETKLASKPNPIVEEVVDSLRKDGFDIELSTQDRAMLVSELRASLTPRFKEIEDRLAILENGKKKN
jgi:hypothetical protein